MSAASDAAGTVLGAVEANPGAILSAGVSLISTIVTLINNASAAKSANAADVITALQKADADLSDALAAAHKALADEVAADDAAIKAAGQ